MVSYLSITQIQYIVISGDMSFNNSQFNLSTLNLLRRLPIDLLQTNDMYRYFSFNMSLGISKGVDLFTIPDFLFNNDLNKIKDILEEHSKYFTKSLLKVIIIDGETKYHEKINKYIGQLDFKYFTILNCRNDELKYYNRKYYFANINELFIKIKNDKLNILSRIQKDYPDNDDNILNFISDKSLFNINPNYRTNITESNYFLINQIIGNYWIEDCKLNNFFDENKINFEKPDRLNKLIKQSGVIDKFHDILYNENIKNHVAIGESHYPPLVLIVPFNFPKPNKLLNPRKLNNKMKSFLRLFKTEQNLEYRFIIEKDFSGNIYEKYIAEIISLLHNRLLFLDCIGYLHAQLKFSPILRLPLIGKSINSELSYLNNNFSSGKNLTKTIKKFGKKLNKLILNEKSQCFIEARNGQIIAISDLPIEWLFLNDYPLCFTHDVCRIPEFNNTSIINNFIHNQRINFTINNRIINNTLVIHCASNKDRMMNEMFQIIDSFKSELGFNSQICHSVSDIKTAINKYKPDLLIFDCHGYSDEKSSTSYLVIDEENKIYLDGNDIIKNGISAPIIFISACSTMPSYGYTKFISDAFFEAGAFTVTATFLPIDLKDAAVLLIRIIGNLKHCTLNTIHSNWLEFISHMLRTSFIHDIIRKEIAKGNLEQEILKSDEYLRILSEIMIFDKRIDSLNKLEELIRSKNREFHLNFENLNKEWLMYTNIGRSDLIYFENWLSEFRKLNLGNEITNELIPKFKSNLN